MREYQRTRREAQALRHFERLYPDDPALVEMLMVEREWRGWKIRQGKARGIR